MKGILTQEICYSKCRMLVCFCFLFKILSWNIPKVYHFFNCKLSSLSKNPVL